MASACEFGVGYKSGGFAGTTATPDQLRGLAQIASFGEPGDSPYKYKKATQDGEQIRPCDYPIEIDAAMRSDLRQAKRWAHARAMIQMQACQISRTGFCGKEKSSKEVCEWAKMIDAGCRAAEQLESSK